MSAVCQRMSAGVQRMSAAGQYRYTCTRSTCSTAAYISARLQRTYVLDMYAAVLDLVHVYRVLVPGTGTVATCAVVEGHTGYWYRAGTRNLCHGASRGWGWWRLGRPRDSSRRARARGYGRLGLGCCARSTDHQSGRELRRVLRSRLGGALRHCCQLLLVYYFCRY